MSELINAVKAPAEQAPFALHLLGWKAFQDLCVTIAEECLRRPVQIFLPTNDAGRDGAFIGRWDGDDPSAGESTIQCKFTSKADQTISVSMLSDELEKAKRLAAAGRAADYVILTNHPITGASDLAIAAAFEAVGVGKCRVFGPDWIQHQIRTSPRLRIMVPRLYGLGDLSDLLDARAYEQAQMILSAMGDDLQRLVVTEAHRKSVRAISKHNVVLLLGAPAAGKSTIGASLAIGAADIWKCDAIRAASPSDIQKHLKPGAPQFFWIDDAWGGTQYQRATIEAWNQVFPLMQAGTKKGTRFLITSRDYVWNAAKADLKLAAFPILNHSQVVINVQELSNQEKAQILYNHLKLGDQSREFKAAIKAFLPNVAELKGFLPETARRVGTKFFASNLEPKWEPLKAFFDKPQEFLQDTIANLAADCKAAIATIFLNGGKISSPIEPQAMEGAASAFGVNVADIRAQVEYLDGSLLLRALDEDGYYWTYKHPTVSDAFAKYLASSPELVAIYLGGASVESILREVVCIGAAVSGYPVLVPKKLYPLLVDRLKGADASRLVSFLSYRSDFEVTKMIIELRPELLKRLSSFFDPISEDSDASFGARLHELGLLPEDWREHMVEKISEAAIGLADASFLTDSAIGNILTQTEYDGLLDRIADEVMADPSAHISRVRDQWDSDYPPDDHFDGLERNFRLFADALAVKSDFQPVLQKVRTEIRDKVYDMNEDYQPASSTSAPTSSSTPADASLNSIFRDVDE